MAFYHTRRRSVVPLLTFLVLYAAPLAARGDTLVVSGVVIRDEDDRRFGGAELGLYMIADQQRSLIANTTSAETGVYTFTKSNVFDASSAWVVYRGDAYAAQ
jgi:hypothetical protein